MAINGTTSLSILLLIFTTLLFGQNRHSGKQEAQQAFEYDLQHSQLKIYVLGGIVPAIRSEDLQVAKQYNFNYHDFGCMPPPDFEYYICYNYHVFDYLNNQHGHSATEKINKQAFGYRDYCTQTAIPVPQK